MQTSNPAGAAAAQAKPCGSWPSPLTPELVAAGAINLAYAGAHDGNLFWTEGRPSEKGRTALMRRLPDGRVHEASPPQADVRTRVHEYGGLPWAATAGGLIYAQYDDQRLRLLAHDGGLRTLTGEGLRYADFHVAPNGRHVLAVREDHRTGGEATTSLVLIDSAALADDGRVLYDGSDFVAGPRLSPDGQQLAWIAWDHPNMPWDSTRLHVGTLANGVLHDVRVIAGGSDGAPQSVLQPEWAVDGGLYFLGDGSGWWNLYRCRPDARGAAKTRALTDLQAEIGGPLWVLGTTWYVPMASGLLLVRVTEGARDRLALFDEATRELRALELPFVAYTSIGRLDARTAFAVAASEDAPPALITIDIESGRHTLVAAGGAAPVAPEWVSRAQALRYPTAPAADGSAREAHAWFYPPQHPQTRLPDGERPPLVVTLHGGPTSHSMPAFKATVQYWTTRGFALVEVNYGGSSSYGRAYRERLRGQWGVVDLQDAVAAVEHLVAQGRVDGERIVIRGGSAGGFTVLCALAMTQRFAAGINYFGVADLALLAADTHKFESRYLDSLVGPLPQAAAVYRERSPLHRMHQCRAALLTLQGSDDRAVPPQQSRDIVAAARAAGCPTAYLEFEGEGHGFRRAANIVRGLQAEEVFLGQVLGHRPAAELPALAIDNAQSLPGSTRPA